MTAGRRSNTVQRLVWDKDPYAAATAVQEEAFGASDGEIEERRAPRAERREDTPNIMHAAGAMSRSILRRIGFEPVGHVHMLLDEFGNGL
jgi:hypothetical protein